MKQNRTPQNTFTLLRQMENPRFSYRILTIWNVYVSPQGPHTHTQERKEKGDYLL